MLENRLIMAESSKLVMFTVQTAAAVLEAVKTMPKYNEVPKSGIGGTLAEHVNMAPWGYVHALLTQVEFLYDIVQLVTKKGEFTYRLPFFPSERRIITAALEAFEAYKRELCKAQEHEFGKGFSSATYPCIKDFTDLNERFLNG